MVGQSLSHARGKMIAVDGQRGTGRKAMFVTGSDDDRVELAHFLMEQADGIFFRVIGAKAVRTDQLGQAIGLVGGRHFAAATHLGQTHFRALFRQLPSCFRSGESAANYMYICHGRLSVVVRL